MSIMTITKNPNPQVLISPRKPRAYFCLLSLFPVSREEESARPSTELTFTTASSSSQCRPQEFDDEVSTTLTLGLPSSTSTQKRKAVDQNPDDHNPPINPKRREVVTDDHDQPPFDPKLHEVLNVEPLRWRRSDSVEVEEHINMPEEEREERDDPWEIKKRLTDSDLGNLCRLLVPKDLVMKHILPYWDGVAAEGKEVRVHDCDTNTTHQLVFKFLTSSKSYILNKNWKRKFVNERDLKLNDKIGLYWDTQTSMFMFSVLERENQHVVH